MYTLNIKGRMKTAYYVATVVSAYRQALDTLLHQGEDAYHAQIPALMAELQKASHRKSNTGFYFGAPQPAAGAAGCEQTMEFVAQVTVGAEAGEPATVMVKNRFCLGDALEVLAPQGSRAYNVAAMTLADSGEPVQTVTVAGTLIHLRFPFAVSEGDILRGENRNHRKREPVPETCI